MTSMGKFHCMSHGQGLQLQVKDLTIQAYEPVAATYLGKPGVPLGEGPRARARRGVLGGELGSFVMKGILRMCYYPSKAHQGFSVLI